MGTTKLTDIFLKETVNGVLAYYGRQRCGYHVKEIHRPCHLDCFVVHPDGRQVSVSGGWHAEGSLSHSLIETAGNVLSLARTAMALKGRDDELADRVCGEVRYGAEWLLRTRFGDGYRCVTAEIGTWTKGIIGDEDDLLLPAHNDPFANFMAAAAEAAAAAVCAEEDEIFGKYCIETAQEDFKLAYERMFLRERVLDIRYLIPEEQILAAAVYAAAKIYELTSEESYRKLSERFINDLQSKGNLRMAGRIAQWTESGYDCCEEEQMELYAIAEWHRAAGQECLNPLIKAYGEAAKEAGKAADDKKVLMQTVKMAVLGRTLEDRELMDKAEAFLSDIIGRRESADDIIQVLFPECINEYKGEEPVLEEKASAEGAVGKPVLCSISSCVLSIVGNLLAAL